MLQKLPPKVSGKRNHRWACSVIKTCIHMLHFSPAARARRGPRGGSGGHMQRYLEPPSLPRPDLDALWLLGNWRRHLQIRALSRSLLRCFLATFLLTCYTQAYIQSECAAQLCCRTTRASFDPLRGDYCHSGLANETKHQATRATGQKKEPWFSDSGHIYVAINV